MNNDSRLPGLAKGLIFKIAAIVRECNDAQRRMAEIRSAPDRFGTRPDVAPDTYGEFLFRTSGPLQREPSAQDRARRNALR
ncbi:MAG TPA: hypothetical protein VK586_22635 [Streptosporangiaceae bacterium]|nr:hypothetical protein [Streptosporangiaceae bacterium]